MVFLLGIASLSADLQDSPDIVEPITISETNLTKDLSQSEVQTENNQASDSLDKPVAEMVAFVQEAVQYARDNKKEDVLAEFSNRSGSFFRGNLYIYAYDFDGITLAHPLQTELIGKSRLKERDAENEYFIRNLRDVALNGSGFVVFHYVNPGHNNAVEKKLGYVEAVDDTWWLGSGIYGENVTLPKEVSWHTPI
ncbi:cache domain-containing protein [Methanospirillum hungatei]|uniref:cache domain-containing protein n=1 Tax=Methanospirillum hungatei TaxID=2203 RepID=UPI0026EDBB27|nr:cache domain-containing protein [Methanospirillum hungatei]MCA1915006.1 cache domain-containing protein [Methanospirillum hungatei]